MAGMFGYDEKNAPKRTVLPLPATPPPRPVITPQNAHMYQNPLGDYVDKLLAPAPAPKQQPVAYSGQVQRVAPSVPTPEMRAGTPQGAAPALGLNVGSRAQPSVGAPTPAPIEPIQLAPGVPTQAQSQMRRGPVEAIPMHNGRVGARAPGQVPDVPSTPVPTAAPAVDYDAVVQRVSDRQVPFQPANVFSDSTAGTGAQHLRPTGWVQDTVQDGHVQLPTAQSGTTPGQPAVAPTFGGMNATQYLASMKAQDAQGRVDANTARLERAREIDMNSARYDIGRAQGINGNRMNAQLYKSANQQLAALEASRVADNLNTTELAKTDALVQGDLEKADIVGQYANQQADITGRYGMMGDYATAQAAGSVAQAGIDKARIAADGVVTAAGIKAQPTAKDVAETNMLNAKLGRVYDAMSSGDFSAANALLVGQVPGGGKVIGDGATGYLFVDASGAPRSLSATEIQNLLAQKLAQQ